MEPPASLHALQELRVILEHATIGIALIRERRILRCNQRFAEIYRFSEPHELVGHLSVSLYPSRADYRNLGREAYPQLAQGQSFRTRIQMRRRGGEAFWCGVTGKLIDPRRPELGSIWIVDDVDDEVRAQAALQQVLTEQRLILEHALVGIVFLKNRQVTRCNHRFEQMFGYPRGSLAGSSSRSWYLSEADWLAAGRACYEPLARGETFRGEMRLGRRDGSALWCEVQAKMIDPADPNQGSIWITLDITRRKMAESELVRHQADLEDLVASRTAELQATVASLHREMAERRDVERLMAHQALHDPVTGLPNRSHLVVWLERALREAQRKSARLAVVVLNIDHFKRINDVHGHRFGDELLRELAQRLGVALRATDVVARLGGDEFVLVLTGLDDADALPQCLHRVQTAVGRPLPGDPALRITASLGVAVFPADGEEAGVLMRHADLAMVQAKAQGRNSHRFFDPALEQALQRRLSLEQALRTAIASDGLKLHYQPQIVLDGGRMVGVEALLRWHRPEEGWISPAHFIPLAEETGLILPLGDWVLRAACAQLRQWRSLGCVDLTVAVNVSATQLAQPGFVHQVLGLLQEHEVPPTQLELEVTEGVAMHDVEQSTATLQQLHAAGVRIAIDDFGTGHASLSYLSRFPLGKLKIDRSFVSRLGQSTQDAVICRTIIAMGRQLGMTVVAEGVETPAQRDALRDFGCTVAQGFLYSPAIAPAQLLSWLGLQSSVPGER